VMVLIVARRMLGTTDSRPDSAVGVSANPPYYVFRDLRRLDAGLAKKGGSRPLDPKACKRIRLPRGLEFKQDAETPEGICRTVKTADLRRRTFDSVFECRRPGPMWDLAEAATPSL